MKPLTPKQSRFVEEYLIDLNATQAAIRAGLDFVETTGFYCYLLIDPRDDAIFYVGKGKGKRIKSHARRAASGAIDNVEKHRRIRAILGAGLRVREVVFAAFEEEGAAFACERELIERLRDYGLTNIVGGVVTNDQLARQQAQDMLDRMISFEQWIANCSPEQLAASARVMGSPKNCYDMIRRELTEIVQRGEQLEIVVGY